MPSETRARYHVVEWLMFQMGNVGPMFGQRGHFVRAAPEKIPYAIDRYTNESRRLLNVIDKRLAESAYLAGDYSIADIATYPWVVGVRREPEQLDSRPNLKRWLDAIGERRLDIDRPAAIEGATHREIEGRGIEVGEAGEVLKQRAAGHAGDGGNGG